MFHRTIGLFKAFNIFDIVLLSNTECSCNTWGPACNQTCHCPCGTCHHVTGYCDSECVPGWSGYMLSSVVALGSILGISLLGNALLIILWKR